MKFTPKQRALMKHSRDHGQRLAMEMPGQFFVVEGRCFGRPCYEIAVRRDYSAADFSEPPNAYEEIPRLILWGEEIWHPSVGEWTLWAEEPAKHLKRVLAAMLAVYVDNNIDAKKPHFWSAVLATLLIEGDKSSGG